MSRIARALEQQRGVLFVIAIDHDGVEVLTHQLLDRGKGFGAGNDAEIQLAENLRHGASGLLVRAKEESLVTHIKFIVSTLVSLIKLRRCLHLRRSALPEWPFQLAVHL